MTKFKKFSEDFKQWDNEDYQNRGGNYPKSDKPVSITGENDYGVTFSFKSTSQKEAERWVKSSREYKEMSKIGLTKIKSYQDGDYDDDWVEVIVKKNKGL